MRPGWYSHVHNFRMVAYFDGVTWGQVIDGLTLPPAIKQTITPLLPDHPGAPAPFEALPAVARRPGRQHGLWWVVGGAAAGLVCVAAVLGALLSVPTARNSEADPRTASASPTPTPDPYYEAEIERLRPKPIATTGDVVRDLEAGGLKPGSGYVGQFELAKKTICNPEITDTSTNFRKSVQMFNAQGPGLVRVAIAYGCPDRLDSAWAYIDK